MSVIMNNYEPVGKKWAERFIEKHSDCFKTYWSNPLNCLTAEQIVGPAGETIQHQQQSGNQENITILVTICEDGTSIAPAVIFKGEYFQSVIVEAGQFFECILGLSKKKDTLMGK
ncbi:hypothetical protein ARMSODRAFT_973349 [Armillaria solidipes]|uniref:HTH CENPB-type domain-containing protein n=1 Tax=Armillaria solidipes TaxID=1076256 RepID=A0A2H3BQ49_9AGAR|nr:hypothetical protein ARMSODRAFT_973349 [Armillaria solidipes]